jgi:protein TonB
VIKTPVHRSVPKKLQKVDKSAEKQQFLSQVRSKIIANKKYPRMALRRHIQGAVKIKFDITSSGDVSNIRYINGKKILQKGARKAIEKSFPITIPSSLRSELPIKDIYLTIHFNIH